MGPNAMFEARNRLTIDAGSAAKATGASLT
jgi:hypothetical protein